MIKMVIKFETQIKIKTLKNITNMIEVAMKVEKSNSKWFKQ